MSLEPLKPTGESVAVMREDAINALRVANGLLEPYLRDAGLLERRRVARRARDTVLDAQLQMFLRRLETFNNAVIAQAKAYYDSELASDKLRYSEALMRDMAKRTTTILEVLQDLGTQDNPFAAQFAQHFVDMWQRGTAEIFNQYGY